MAYDRVIVRAEWRSGMSKNTIQVGHNAAGVFIAGNENRVEATVKQAVSLPDPATIRIAEELAGLRAVLVTLKSADAAKLRRALDDAEEEAIKPDRTSMKLVQRWNALSKSPRRPATSRKIPANYCHS